MIEGATENAAVVKAPIDNLTERRLDPDVPGLFVIVENAPTPRYGERYPDRRTIDDQGRRPQAIDGPRAPSRRHAVIPVRSGL
jgi:hypothetical protein